MSQLGWTSDNHSLPAAIAELYRVFSRYPLRPDTQPCLHCHSLEEEEVLHAKPLEQLSANDVASYASDALLTWGEVADLKHFLPRLFEIVTDASERWTWPDIEIVFSKLRHGNWRTWPAEGIAVIERFFAATWSATLALWPFETGRYTGGLVGADELLCALAQALDDLSSPLSVWLLSPLETSAWHLARFIREEGQALTRASGLGAFWSDRSAQELQVRRWALSRPVYEKLEGAFFTATTEPARRELSEAVDILAVLI